MFSKLSASPTLRFISVGEDHAGLGIEDAQVWVRDDHDVPEPINGYLGHAV